MYRLNTEVKVSMAFITPSNVVTRLINSMETVPRCLTMFYHVTNQTMLPSNTCTYTEDSPLINTLVSIMSYIISTSIMVSLTLFSVDE